MLRVSLKNIGIKFQPSKKVFNTLRSFMTSTAKGGLHEGFWALKDISFDIQDGETFGVIGNNGAGKSTLLRTIAGIYPPDKGSVETNGSVSALLSLGTGFQGDLSGIDNIYLNGLLLGFSKDEINEKLNDIVGFSELGDFIYAPVKTYSSGMSARLGFSIAAHINCDILLIDEVLGVGDKDFKAKSKKKIEELLLKHKTVILVSHSMNEISKYCLHTVWIEKGNVKMIGPTKDVIKEYMGKK